MKKLYIVCTLFMISAFATAQNPAANFTADVTTGCSPIIVKFKDLSTGNVTSWQWDFGNGATSSKQHPSATYFDPGTYTVRLTVKNANGENTTVKTAFITVLNPPQASISSDRTTGCSPARIQFSGSASTPQGTTITGWHWDFGDGGTSSLKDPVYYYREPGSYSVTLTITNNAGCTKLVTRANMIKVSDGVKPSFTYPEPPECSAPTTLYFNNTSVGPGNLTYQWNFGNNATSTAKNPSAHYTTNGLYKVVLIVSSSEGCTDSLVKPIQVGRVNTDFIVPASICPGVPVQFLNNSDPRPIKATWKFSNGTTDTLRNGTNIFPEGGTYTVTLINRYTVCTDTLVKTVTVQPAPDMDFTVADSSSCAAPFTAKFNSINGVSFTWDFGDSTATSSQANPSHTYTGYGDFDVTLIATGSNGCTDTLTKPGYIKIRKPVISFSDLPAEGCIPYTANFVANVETLDSVVSWSWDFGDNSGRSTERNPQYVYNNAGTYPVTLTIRTVSGCTETYRMDEAVMVGTKPTAAFTSDVTNACAQPGIQFLNNSTNATRYLWTFSDGTSSTKKDPLHTFNNTGNISVTLTAINNGCKDVITKENYATIKPSVSRFDYKPNCGNPLQYSFTDKSVGATTWEWNFGDNSPVFTGQNPPAHTFPAKGSYEVSLKTTNGSCTYVLKRTVTIKDLTPDFSAPVTEGCRPFMPTMRPTVPDGGLVANYIWDFGEGDPIDFGHGQHGRYTYKNGGQYSVTLTTVDTFGCSHSITKPNYITVNGSRANFASVDNNGCKGMITNFIDSSKTDGINAIQSWRWSFGDGQVKTFTAPPFRHQYDSVGDYDVKLVITDAKGCVDSILKREFVKVSEVKADWTTPGLSCPGGYVTFTNKSTSDLPFTNHWDFGDGGSSTTYDTRHTYLDTGFYTVKYVIRDIVGCADSLVVQNAVEVSKPIADFDANNFTSYCTPFHAKFTNTSTFYKISNWDLSVATSTAPDPKVYYTETGTYPVKLVVYSWGECKDSITKTVRVYNPQDATMTYSPLDGCTPRTVHLSAFAPMKASFVWDFGDGNVIDTSANEMDHLYVDYGDFVPRIILREPSGTCIIPLVGKETIHLLGVKPKYEIDQMLFCDAGTIHITDSTTSNDRIVKYTWDFGDGTTDNSVNPQHYYAEPGQYSVNVTVETANGCVDSLRQGPIKVVASPQVTLTADSSCCVNELVHYKAELDRPDTSDLVWKWVFPNGNTYQVQNPPPQKYPADGDFSYQMVVTNSSGCADSISRSLRVHPLPTIDLPGSLTKMVGVPLKIPAAYSNGIVDYRWNPSETLDCSDCPEPTSSTKFDIRYMISVTDSNSCRSNAEVQVHVLCKGTTIFLPNTFSPNGDGMNDRFFVRGVGLARVKSMRVFNRWGEVVFEQRDFPVENNPNPSYGWDGRYKGRQAQPDVYIYQVEIYCENGEVMRYEGNVALIR